MRVLLLVQDGFPTPELQGLIPNSFEHIFQEVEASTDKQWMVRASYLEIYNEEVRGSWGGGLRESVQRGSGGEQWCDGLPASPWGQVSPPPSSLGRLSLWFAACPLFILICRIFEG